MIKIIQVITSLEDFDAWRSAVDTKRVILACNKDAEFMQLVKKVYPDGMTETELNDMLRFSRDWVYEALGIDTKQVITACDKDAEFMQLVKKVYPDGMTETELNDMLRFKRDWIYETLGIEQESD